MENLLNIHQTLEVLVAAEVRVGNILEAAFKASEEGEDGDG